MNDRDLNRLHDMLDAAHKARSFIEGEDRSILDRNEMLALAVTRLLEIIGEAARHVSEETQAQISDLPWTAIIGMRHRIVHDYLAVDMDVVWDTLTIDLVDMIRVVEDVLSTD